MAININREVEDTFYRYKMPKLTAKVEGKGNGIKTVIVNVSDIAKALNRKPIYVTKFFGCELGAQIHVDDKNDRYIVNGAHDAAKLQELLDGFIKKFVLCESCGNPETTMHVNKKTGNVDTTCKACGSHGHLDVAHRLTQYIVKNPPEADVSSKVKSKRGKRVKNGDKASDDDRDPSVAGGDDTSRSSPTENAQEDDDEDWGEDTTEEAQLKRMNELSDMAKSLALSIDVEKSDTQRADIFFKHLKDLLSKNQVLSHQKEIRREADRLSLGPRAVIVLAEVLLSPSHDTVLADIKKYAPIFTSFTRYGDNQKRAQHYVLCAMCMLIERSKDPKLLSKSCHMLKAFYDNDIVEEDVILAWSNKGPSKKLVSPDLHSKIVSVCAPMIKWLNEAEEADSEEDEDEEDNAVSGDSEVDSASAVPAPTVNPQSKEESEDDIDIDAI